MAKITISEIKNQFGISRTKVMKAIKSGDFSGVKDDNGWWTFEVSEVVRCFGEPVSKTPYTANNETVGTPSNQPENNALLGSVISTLQEQLAEKDKQIEKLQEANRNQLLLIEPPRGWFRRLFG